MLFYFVTFGIMLTGPPNLGFINPCRKPAEHLLKAVDGVTMKDITSVAEKIISSPLTMASHGNGKWQLVALHCVISTTMFLTCLLHSAVLNMPTYESVSGKFRSK